MKIRIKAEGCNIRIWLPTSMLKSRIFYKILRHGVEKNDKIIQHSSEEQPSEGLPEIVTQKSKTPLTRAQQLTMYQALKDAIKTHGHFNLVEIESSKGEKVLIRV